MNITMIAGSFYLIFLFCGFGFRKTAMVTVLIVIAYVGLAGTGIPIQRAGYGAVLVLVAAMAGRPANLLNSLCLAFFAILVWNPQSLWSIGFQLSFLCVLSLILILPLLAHVNAWILSLGSSLAVLFGTFPVVLYYFNIFSPISILANVVAIPLCDAALLISLFALLLSGIPFLGVLLAKISSWIILCLLTWVKYLSAWRWGYLFLKQPSLAWLAVYYMSVAVILFMNKKTFSGKRILMAGLICGWLVLSGSLFTGSGGEGFELTVLSSGKNQIAHTRFSNGAHWLLNTGRHFPSDQGEWLIDPYLRHKGVQRLEGIFLTDFYKKNTGGLVSVLRDFPVRYVLYPSLASLVPDELYRYFRTSGRKTRSFRQGDEVLMGGEKIRVIAQSPKGAALLIVAGLWRLLLISRWDEELFTGILGSADAAEIHAVLLPASGYGVPAGFCEWLDQSRPLLAILPDREPEIVRNLTPRGIPFLDLKHSGALSFTQNGSRLELTSFLQGPLGVYAYP